MKVKVAPTKLKKQNNSLRLVLFFPFRCCFAGSLRFSLSTVKQTKLFHSISEMFFTFLARKTLWVKLFSLNVCEAALQAAIKGGNFGAKLTHLCGVWLDVSFFSCEKTSFAILIGRIIFFTCENHRSLLLLARTNLRTKIYDIAFWWVFLGMYIINHILRPRSTCKVWPEISYVDFFSFFCHNSISKKRHIIEISAFHHRPPKLTLRGKGVM